ncbi:MAG: Stp1/IreP family PP2C-type Ser/Thr phosphatase [Halobacteriovoraceae bacterium]|nr:Stp1/IreP family PP2C-type Ser/Thr phosphatase [Halobacteriovoraceae bacterium]MCB9093627.1 Stp1/IreP family PP2C-type Ser/Thr phosphatase [Halobacteriovoraceae bacterium]
MPLLCTGKTDRGRVRKSNQDSIFIDPINKCFVVADGMGGHRGGDIASQLTVKIFSDHFAHLNREQRNKINDVTLCIERSNRKIFEKSQTEPLLNGMGTTIVSLIIEKSKAFVANVGDSRAYLINNTMIYQLTKDHSLVQEKVNLGIYTREEACKDKMKNVLVRTLGFEDRIKIDLFEYSISKNDIFLLCSDGLYGKVYDKEIMEIVNRNIPSPSLATPQDLDKTVQELIDAANEYGGNDNISVILAVAQGKASS